jgi:hypothetical protein
VELSGKTNALKMVKKGGDHRTRIKSFPEVEQAQILDSLTTWLAFPITNESNK